MKQNFTFEDINNMAFENGYGNISFFYTGGGFYCGYAALSDNWAIFNNEDWIIFIDTDPRKVDSDIAFDSVWQEEHTVYIPETDDEARTIIVGILNTFLELYESEKVNTSPNDIIDFDNCNLSINDIEDWLLEIADSDITEDSAEPDYKVVETVDVAGPSDAYMDFFFDLAIKDRFYGSDENECPVHSMERAADLGKISNYINKCTEQFFIAIGIDPCDNDPFWFITESFEDIEPKFEKFGFLISKIYRMSVDEDYECELEIVEPAHRTEIEENYCPDTDTTFVTKCVLEYGEIKSREVIAFYHGEPNRMHTGSCFGGNGSLKATYEL